MAYANFDDKMGRHPRIAGLSDAAFRLHVCGILHCAEWLTDGRIEACDVPDLVRKFRKAALDELVREGRWVPIAFGDGPVEAYIVHDYLDHNMPRDIVLARREKAKKNSKEWREQQKSNQERTENV